MRLHFGSRGSFKIASGMLAALALTACVESRPDDVSSSGGAPKADVVEEASLPPTEEEPSPAPEAPSASSKVEASFSFMSGEVPYKADLQVLSYPAWTRNSDGIPPGLFGLVVANPGEALAAMQVTSGLTDRTVTSNSITAISGLWPVGACVGEDEDAVGQARGEIAGTPVCKILMSQPENYPQIQYAPSTPVNRDLLISGDFRLIGTEAEVQRALPILEGPPKWIVVDWNTGFRAPACPDDEGAAGFNTVAVINVETGADETCKLV